MSDEALDEFWEFSNFEGYDFGIYIHAAREEDGISVWRFQGCSDEEALQILEGVCEDIRSRATEPDA